MDNKHIIERQREITRRVGGSFNTLEKAQVPGRPPVGKEHLTTKVITDRNGNRKTVYVNTTQDTPGQKKPKGGNEEGGEKKLSHDEFAGMMQIIKEEYEKGGMTEQQYKNLINRMSERDPSNQREEKFATESSGQVGHTITSKDGTKGTIIHSDESGHIIEYQQDGQELHAHMTHDQFETGKEKGHFTHEAKTGDEHPFEDVDGDGDGKTGEKGSKVEERDDDNTEKSYQPDIIGNGISFEERQANKISQFYK